MLACLYQEASRVVAIGMVYFCLHTVKMILHIIYLTVTDNRAFVMLLSYSLVITLLIVLLKREMCVSRLEESLTNLRMSNVSSSFSNLAVALNEF